MLHAVFWDQQMMMNIYIFYSMIIVIFHVTDAPVMTCDAVHSPFLSVLNRVFSFRLRSIGAELRVSHLANAGFVLPPHPSIGRLVSGCVHSAETYWLLIALYATILRSFTNVLTNSSDDVVH